LEDVLKKSNFDATLSESPFIKNSLLFKLIRVEKYVEKILSLN